MESIGDPEKFSLRELTNSGLETLDWSANMSRKSKFKPGICEYGKFEVFLLQLQNGCDTLSVAFVHLEDTWHEQHWKCNGDDTFACAVLMGVDGVTFLFKQKVLQVAITC